MLITPIIFLTIVHGIAAMGDMKKVGMVGGKALLYFEIVSTLALFIGLIVANLLKPGVNFKLPDNFEALSSTVAQVSSQEMKWGEFIFHIIPKNIVKAFADGDILQVLFFSILFAVGVSQAGETGRSILKGLDRVSKVFFKMMNMIMKLAPIGAFGGMAYTIGEFGLSSIIPMANLMLCVYFTMAIFIFVVLQGICRFYGIRFWAYLRFIKEELLIVLGTSSSESALPNMMDKMHRFGASKSVVGLVIPTGYSFNLDGTSIYLSMAVIFLAQVFKVDLSLSEQLTILFILMVTSKGAAAVTGGGFIVLASTLAALKIIPVEGIALLLGVDRFMSEARSITNLIGNGIATLVIAKSVGEYQEPDELPTE